jgi:hypothetical protein
LQRSFRGFLSFEQALFGDPELGLCSMASSSKFVGHFLDKEKHLLVDFGNKTYDPDLRDRVLLYMDKAASGEDILPLAAQFGKDELLAQKN